MSNSFVQRGGLWVVSQSVLMLAVIVCGVVWRHQWHSLPATVGGAVLLLIGAICGVAGKKVLGRNLTPFPKPPPGTQLVQTGIYGLMRHPLYTAVTCACLGWALVWRSWPALGAALLLGLLFDAKARREECWLRERFPEYADYQRRVKRFLPGLY